MTTNGSVPVLGGTHTCLYLPGHDNLQVMVTLDPEGVTVELDAQGVHQSTLVQYPDFAVPAVQSRDIEDLLPEARDYEEKLAALGVPLTKELLRLRLKVSSGRALKVLQTLRAESGRGMGTR